MQPGYKTLFFFKNRRILENTYIGADFQILYVKTSIKKGMVDFFWKSENTYTIFFDILENWYMKNNVYVFSSIRFFTFLRQKLSCNFVYIRENTYMFYFLYAKTRICFIFYTRKHVYVFFFIREYTYIYRSCYLNLNFNFDALTFSFKF